MAIEIIILFYQKKMPLDEFVVELRANSQLQSILNEKDVVKEVLDTWGKSATQEQLKLMLDRYGRTNTEKLLKSYERYMDAEFKNENSTLIINTTFWCECRDVLRRPKNFKRLETADAVDIVLTELEAADDTYVINEYVKNIIQNYLFENIAKIKSAKDGVKLVQIKLEEIFPCDKSKPKWIQESDWQFDDNGKPLIFKEQIKLGTCYYKYIFYDPVSKMEKVVEQSD